MVERAPLDTNDERLSAVSRVGNSLWAVHSIGFPTTSRNSRGAIRWYQFDESTNTLVQPAGTIFDSTNDYSFPSIAANQFGDVVIGFTRSSRLNIPAPYAVVGATDPTSHVTTFGAPMLLAAGVQAYDFGGLAPNRWGDYKRHARRSGRSLHFLDDSGNGRMRMSRDLGFRSGPRR